MKNFFRTTNEELVRNGRRGGGEERCQNYFHFHFCSKIPSSERVNGDRIIQRERERENYQKRRDRKNNQKKNVM